MSDPRLVEIRRQFGDVYATVFNDEFVVPWKPLSLGEYLKYDSDITRMFIPAGALENEVFAKCVTDLDIVARMNDLPAGVITTVVQNIWSISGPESLDQLSSDFELARAQVTDGRGALYHQCAQCIATAFSYTLEQIYSLDYSTFLLRLAQAEQKLLTTGAISKPLEILKPTTPKLGKIPQPNRPKIDAKKIWDERHKPHQQVQPAKVQPDKDESRKSPILQALDEGKTPKIPFREEKVVLDEFSLDTHEKLERGAMRQYIVDSKLESSRQQLINDAQWIYKDVIEELAKRKKK